MRIESMGLLTWLLTAIAAWAVLVWALAVLGMGGRIAVPPSRTDAPRVSAKMPAFMSERLRAEEEYAAIITQPLFSDDRKPKSFQLVIDAAPAPTEGVRLTGVVITPKLQLATLQTSEGRLLRLRLGTEVAGWRLLSIQPRSATAIGPGGEQLLELQTYHGEGESGGTATVSVDRMTSPLPASDTTGMTHPLVRVSPRTSAGPLESGPNDVAGIRQRIEARRRLMQQQQQSPSADSPVVSDSQ